jgi:glycosyltransferase involved in cell wall biosynthesis
LKSILIVNCVFPPEPVVSAQIGQELATKLSDNCIPVIVIAPYPSRPYGFNFKHSLKYKNKINEEKINENLSVYRLPSFIYPSSNLLGRLYESISFGWHSYIFINKYAHGLDKVYMNTWPIFAQYAVAKACVKNNVPFIIHVQDIYPESIVNKLPKLFGKIVKTLLMPFEKYVLKHAYKVLVISENMRLQLAKTRFINHDKFIIIYNWQDENQFNENVIKHISNNKFTFTYLGNIGSVAGVETLIMAFQHANLNDCCLTIAGNGSQKMACIEIAKATPHLDIKFIDVPSGSVAAIQKKADILLLPVIKGGALSSIPSKLIAYMLSAKPILASIDKESESARIITDAKCGWLINAEDINGLAKRMQEVSILTNINLKNLGQNGFNYCLKNFSKKNNLNKLMSAIVNDNY